MTHCRRIMLEELQRRNFSPTTIRSYLYAVERFARHFKCRPDRLNHTHLRSYQAHLLRTGQLQPKTVRLHVSALRFFFVKTLRRRYLLDDTPYPKAPQRLPSILSVEEMAHLIEAADGLYHRTMLMVLYSTGMRIVNDAPVGVASPAGTLTRLMVCPCAGAPMQRAKTSAATRRNLVTGTSLLAQRLGKQSLKSLVVAA